MVKEFSTVMLFVETVVVYQAEVARLHGNQYRVSLALGREKIAKLLQTMQLIITSLNRLLSKILKMIMKLRVRE